MKAKILCVATFLKLHNIHTSSYEVASYIEHLEVWSTAIDPSYHHVWADHSSVGRQTEAHPASSADVHGEVDNAFFPGEVPMQSIFSSGIIQQNCAERVTGAQVSKRAAGEAHHKES